jgi:hypothetical protein
LKIINSSICPLVHLFICPLICSSIYPQSTCLKVAHFFCIEIVFGWIHIFTRFCHFQHNRSQITLVYFSLSETTWGTIFLI